MSKEIHARVPAVFRLAAVLPILLMLPGCASVSSHDSLAGSPAFPVPAVNASVSNVKEAPEPVSDDEVSAALVALRDASAWGAEYYESPMYAKAQTAYDAALAARDANPARCRSLLAQVIEAAGSAKEAALQAYQEDVKSRFQDSRSKLTEIGADRAFPDEFAQLLSGIDATASLFAARSYGDARFKAYNTLKGMSDLYDTVRGLREWLKDARVQVESALEADQALDASRWASAEMQTAQQKYHDALAQMQAGDLKTAVESMKAAGQMAQRVPLLRHKMETQGPGIPLADRPVPPENNKETASALPTVKPPSDGVALSGQKVRIADMSMSSLGAPQRLYTTFSAAVARFDLVAAEGLSNAGVMEKVLSGMDDGWEAAVSRSGYFGFIYNDRIQMVKDLGSYPEKGEFLHTPYAAQFRLMGTRFAMNLVLCHIRTSKERGLKTAEMDRLSDVYRYYENLTGNHGITLLLAGGLTGLPGQASESLIPQGEMISLRTNLAPSEGSKAGGRRMFASAALQPLIQESGIREDAFGANAVGASTSGASAPGVAYVVLNARK